MKPRVLALVAGTTANLVAAILRVPIGTTAGQWSLDWDQWLVGYYWIWDPRVRFPWSGWSSTEDATVWYSNQAGTMPVYEAANLIVWFGTHAIILTAGGLLLAWMRRLERRRHLVPGGDLHDVRTAMARALRRRNNRT